VKRSVTRIEQAHQRGELRSEDGTLHPFARDGMASEWQFDELQPEAQRRHDRVPCAT